MYCAISQCILKICVRKCQPHNTWSVWHDAKEKSIEAKPTKSLLKEKEGTLHEDKDAFLDTIQEAEDRKAEPKVPKKKARKTKLEKLKSGTDDGKVPKV